MVKCKKCGKELPAKKTTKKVAKKPAAKAKAKKPASLSYEERMKKCEKIKSYLADWPEKELNGLWEHIYSDEMPEDRTYVIQTLAEDICCWNYKPDDISTAKKFLAFVRQCD